MWDLLLVSVLIVAACAGFQTLYAWIAEHCSKRACVYCRRRLALHRRAIGCLHCSQICARLERDDLIREGNGFEAETEGSAQQHFAAVI